MISGFLQGMSFGKTVVFEGIEYIVIQHLGMVKDGKAYCLAIKAVDSNPRPTYFIEAPADFHLKGGEG